MINYQYIGVGGVFIVIAVFLYKTTISIVIRKILSAICSSALTSKADGITHDLRKAFCEYQIEYTNFHFNLTQSHLKFKRLYLLTKGKENISKSKQENIAQVFKDFEKTLLDDYASVLGGITKQIKTYFLNSRYSSRLPRVHVYIRNPSGQYQNLLPENVSSDTPKDPKDYTIFESVIRSGTPYLDNNIIYTALNKPGYNHAGLKLDEIATIHKNYSYKVWKKRIPQRIKRVFTKKPDLDKAWKSCFKWPIQVDNSYKSHLAVPITFRAHAIDGNLNKDFIKLLKLPEDGRTILGIVVVDHIDTHYFDYHDPEEYENIDVNIMYQFADLISLLIVLHLNFSVGSETYEAYNRQIGH